MIVIEKVSLNCEKAAEKELELYGDCSDEEFEQFVAEWLYNILTADYPFVNHKIVVQD